MWNKESSSWVKKVFLSILLILALISFYLINVKNYTKIIEIKRQIVEHPENLPTKEVAKNSSLGFMNLKADLYWLQAIQYIWWNALSSDYKKYLYTMLDIITELNPNFEHPYIIWELLLPSYNQRYEKLSKEDQNNNIIQWINIWKKWVENFCDMEKVEAIKSEYDFDKLKNDSKFKNPCKSYKIPYNLAFIYYHYLNKPDIASFYYRVAYANDDTVEWAKIMAAIMKWKWWNREKSFFMFLNMASENKGENQVCGEFSKELIKASKNFKWELILRSDTIFIKQIEEFRKNLFPNKSEDDIEKISDDISCLNYLNKAVRELNLNYIELADKTFKEKTWDNSYTAKELYKWNYLEFLPTDPQSSEKLNIIYHYNDDTKNYDYKAWEY